MKFIFVLFLLLKLPLFGDTPYQEDLLEFQRTFAEQMEKEYGLLWKGTASRLHEQIEELGLQFVAYRKANLEEARVLERHVITKLIQAVNDEKKIQPYLAQRPFKQVSVGISFDGPNGRYSDGTIAHIFNVVDLYSNQITYYSHDPFEDKFVKEFEEPFEELSEGPTLHRENPYETEIDLLLWQFSNQMAEQYDLHRWSIGGKLTNGIEEIGAMFKTYQPMSQEQARQLIVEVAEKLLLALNTNAKIKPYLKQVPFPPNFLKIKIVAENIDDHKSFPDVSIETVMLEGNRIYYLQKTLYPKEEDSIFRDSDIYLLPTESFSDAQTFVKKNPVVLKNHSSFFQRLKKIFHF